MRMIKNIKSKEEAMQYLMYNESVYMCWPDDGKVINLKYESVYDVLEWFKEKDIVVFAYEDYLDE